MTHKYLLILSLLLIVFTAYSQPKTFLRDYTYRASETDSKVSSRREALKEVKALLIEELGTYVESYVNYGIKEKDDKISKSFFTNEIKTLSAGMTETEIVEEKWDGYTYYIKAKIKADPDEVLRRINQTLSARKKSLVIDSLIALIEYSDIEMKQKSKEIDEVKQELSRKNEQLKKQLEAYNEAKKELESVKAELSEYEREEKVVNDEIAALRQKVLAQGSETRNFIRIGMTREEITEKLGIRRLGSSIKTLDYRAEMTLRVIDEEGFDAPTYFYALGDTWFYFDAFGLIGGVWTHDKMQLIKNTSSPSKRLELMQKYNIGKKLY